MATSGSFDFNLTKVGNLTNNSIAIGQKVTAELENQGDLIGLGIAIAIALTLIFGAVFVAIMIIPRLIRTVKSFKKA